MRALHAEGLPIRDIAEKFEVTHATVLDALGIEAPEGMDPRTVATYQRFWMLMGEAVLTSAEVGQRMGGKSASMAGVYLQNFRARGLCEQVMKVGGKALWRMVKVDELLPKQAA
jgi:transposase